MAADTDTQPGTDLDEAAMLDLAMKADAGEFDPFEDTATPATSEKPPAEEIAKKETPKSDNPTEDKTKLDPDKGTGTKPEDDKHESAYAKAQKERERQDRSWKKLEEEKAALRAEKESIEKQKQEAETAKVKANVYRDDKGYSADDYEQFAKETEDPDLAKKARDRAESLRREAGEQKARVGQQDFVSKWNESLTKVLEENEELRDENSDMGKALKAVLKERPVFSMAPDGLMHAVEFVKLQRQSGLVPALESKVKELETEIARLNKATGLSPGGPSQRPVTKSFDEMTSAEQDAELEKLALEADRGGTN